MSHDQAMFCDAFPCNPKPFCHALRDHLAAGGSIKDSISLRLLWTLTAIICGQCARINLQGISNLHKQHCLRLPGRGTPLGVLDAMEREAENLGTTDTKETWQISISSLLFYAYGDSGDLDLTMEWCRLYNEFEDQKLQAKAA